jgi:hypothetical protein
LQLTVVVEVVLLLVVEPPVEPPPPVLVAPVPWVVLDGPQAEAPTATPVATNMARETEARMKTPSGDGRHGPTAPDL